ncbi:MULTISPECIES: hypothetical protein [unclassified Synechocystis]|uniref:hypothetical protein n=1 Tax=unclassified Synechocystis TaxID=2640012 RepID=UPI00040C8291|nr:MULTISPECIES: hypothetical protein [unclassified Synechocystis]AIE75334.1 Carboxysome protein CcmN [Synechocystis sp. PCC 6714]MCT0253570.1 hypothetical protein [Synechocystis sp. CS-94]
MQLPPVHSVSVSEYFVSGNVIIHETAVIAPGVILEAAPDCQVTIDAGVCIGLGSVITAHAGDVKIQEQVAIAPGCLLIGPVTIGQAACLGSRSTIFQQNIDAQALIPPGSLLINPIADIRTETETVNRENPPPAPEAIDPIPSPWDSEAPEKERDWRKKRQKDSISSGLKDSDKSPTAGPTSPAQTEKQPPPGQNTEKLVSTSPVVMDTAPLVEEIQEKPPVVGQVYINQLLLTLFPERKYFSS